MDCAACGKPISVTAKFCGKCGAPVKRPAKAPDTETAPDLLSDDGHGHAHAQEEVHAHVPHADPAPVAADTEIEDLVVTLSPPPAASLNNASLMALDLNLDDLVQSSNEPVLVVSEPTAPVPSFAQDEVHDQGTLQRLEQLQQELKKTLEKHSLLLDFISLASQQQTHQQSQPHPSEPLLHNLIEQQTQFAVQLAQLHNHVSQAAPGAGGRLPEELKLLLEKQRIEIQKSFTLGIAQNTENLTTAQAAEMTKVQDMLTANTLAAQAIEKNLTPLIQSVNDLKTKVQAVVKKVDELPAASRKTSHHDDSDDKQGGGAMIFVIGLLCGLTVVLSSLAIYNFLSHDSHASAAAHDAAPADTAAHDDKASAHDKPAAHSSKDKAH